MTLFMLRLCNVIVRDGVLILAQVVVAHPSIHYTDYDGIIQLDGTYCSSWRVLRS